MRNLVCLYMQVICAGKTDAKGHNINIRTNFEQYGLMPWLGGLLRMDVHTHPFRPDLEEVGVAITAIESKA